MSLIDKLKFNLLDPVDATIGLIEKWSPRKCKSEKDYENSLFKYLNQHLPDIQITKQFSKGRIRADLLVGTKVIIEIKKDLSTTAQYQRLIGQLTDYKEWEGRIVVLLVGETDSNLMKSLKAFAEEQVSFWEPKVRIFEK